MKKECLLAILLIASAYIVCAETAPISEVRLILISAIDNYFVNAESSVLTGLEIKDLLAAYDLGENPVDLSVTGDLSGETLPVIYQRFKKSYAWCEYPKFTNHPVFVTSRPQAVQLFKGIEVIYAIRLLASSPLIEVLNNNYCLCNNKFCSCDVDAVLVFPDGREFYKHLEGGEEWWFASNKLESPTVPERWLMPGDYVLKLKSNKDQKIILKVKKNQAYDMPKRLRYDSVNCDSIDMECGVWPDGCGREFSCGKCSTGNVCVLGKCTTGIPLDWNKTSAHSLISLSQGQRVSYLSTPALSHGKYCSTWFNISIPPNEDSYVNATLLLPDGRTYSVEGITNSSSPPLVLNAQCAVNKVPNMPDQKLPGGDYVVQISQQDKGRMVISNHLS
ncbi:hypothetical protein FJZ53_00030 [Candidatus Woesearchaeota archaeon]|nr:hypothetical protein [Candidatus Woesearchaeota archaeon]